MKTSLHGQLDGWPGLRRRTHVASLRQCRSQTLAHVAQWASDRYRTAELVDGTLPRDVSVNGWTQLSAADRSGYLDGTRQFGSRFLSALTDEFPLVNEVQTNPLWASLNSETDLRRLRAITIDSGSQSRLSILLDRLLPNRPRSSIELDVGQALRDVALLVAIVRLSGYAGDNEAEFKAARALIYALSVLPLVSPVRYCSVQLQSLVLLGVLRGRHDSRYQIAVSDALLERWHEWLMRQSEIIQIASGYRLLRRDEALDTSVLVDCLHPFVQAFASPGIEERDALIDRLQRCSRTPSGRELARVLDSDLPFTGVRRPGKLSQTSSFRM